MATRLPQRTHLYRNHHIDSLRWDPYAPRDDDIVIATSYKSGTTWTQNIVRELIVYAAREAGVTNPDLLPEPDTLSSLWIDARWTISAEEAHAKIEAQAHRRFLKTHLALDGLLYYPQVKYMVITRDPRDVFMSIWNHYAAYTDKFYQQINENPDRPGAPLPRCPDNIHDFWRDWISRGWFDWEHEGYPFWGNMHHTQSWWRYRHLKNICFYHYADMLADPAGAVRDMAQFLDIDLSDQALHAIVAHTDIAAMRARATTLEERRNQPSFFRGGARTFFYKGTNGRWRELLSSDELILYEQTKEQVLTPDCAKWLENGKASLG